MTAQAAPRAATLSHRPALDGLRGLAVLAVLLHHAGYLRGGYLGVDLFFVLSGFLITTLLLEETRRTSQVDRAAFWIRRARRLLPAAWAVIVAITLWSAYEATGGELPRIRRDAIAAILYVENWSQIASGSDYWDLNAPPSMFRHFWSLAVEEQFYILWPIAFVAIAVVARRHLGRFGLRRVLAVFAIAGGTASYCLGVWLYQPGTPTIRIYYGSDTRIGAILLGVALAAISRWDGGTVFDRPLAGPQAPKGWLGGRGSVLIDAALVAALAALVGMWVLLDGTSRWLWRGGLAVAGILATVVLAGVAAGRARPVVRALSWKPLCWVGAISYGLYLWHWPVFIILDPRRLGLRGVPLLAVRFLAAFAIASISYYVLEVPVRRGRLSPRRLGVVGAASAVMVLAVTLWATSTTPVDQVNVASRREASAGGVGVLPGGEVPRLLILGDSVAVNLGAAFEEIAKSGSIEAWNQGRLGCPVTEAPSRYKSADGVILSDPSYCDGYASEWGTLVDSYRPNLVLVMVGSPIDRTRDVGGGRWAAACEPGNAEWFSDGLEYGLSKVTGRGIEVVMFTIPYFRGFDAPDNADTMTDCRNAVVRSVAARHPDVQLVDLAGFICDADHCVTKIDGVVARPDGIHFANEVTQQVAAWILDQLESPDANDRLATTGPS